MSGELQNSPSELRALVTRSRRGPGRLRKRLEVAGFSVLSVPTIGFREIESAWPEQLFDVEKAWDFTIVTSRTTIDFFVDRWTEGDIKAKFANCGTIAAVGRSTAERLEELGVHVSFVPDSFDAEGLVECLDGIVKQGDRVAIPRAKDARAVLPDALASWGAKVSVIPVYEAFLPVDSVRLLEKLEPSDIDVLTFASSKTVEHFVELLDSADHWLKRVPCGCIGPITQETARKAGFAVMGTPEEASFDGLVALLERWRDQRSAVD